MGVAAIARPPKERICLVEHKRKRAGVAALFGKGICDINARCTDIAIKEVKQARRFEDQAYFMPVRRR